ncbi:SHOCT domain-containing protein [Nocardioides sp.]|uniref:SHOCT domain-containing protein n=1 Tax=Nocardioides sp. TaxID=35761 RepID=UPI002ED0D5C4
MSFWDILWFIIISYAFIAYLMLLFNILVDVFRDDGMSGFGKAGWTIFLILVPLIAALVYLIARGNDMAARHRAHLESQIAAQDDYIRSVAGTKGGGGATSQVAEAKALLDSGAITQSEFETLKAKALA